MSDRGRQFTADIVEELLRLCGYQYPDIDIAFIYPGFD